MEYGFSRRAEIEGKLAEDKRKLAALKESLAAADSLTHNMVNILNQFDERLHKLEETILPVHRKTKDLQRMQDNIDKTLSAFDHIISYHHVAREVEPILRQGPSRQVEEYISCMVKLSDAVKFFSENNPDSPELNTVNALFDTGKDGLEHEFQTLLSRHTKPAQPEQLLLAIKETEGKQSSPKASPNTLYNLVALQPKATSDLAKMAKWLHTSGKQTEFATNYATTRSSNLLKTLLALKDHVRDQGLNPGSRKPSTIRDTPKKGGSRRPSAFRKASTLLRKESLQSLGSLGGLKGSSYPTIAEDETVEIDLEPFLNMITLGEKLFMVELQLMQNIIPDARNLFDSVIQDSLGMMEQDGAKFVTFANQCVTRRDHPSVVAIFPAIKHLKHELKLYLDILQGASESSRVKIPKLIGELDYTAAKVLDDFTDSVKSDPDKGSNMPKDGTVHELTSNAMLFLQQLVQNLDVAGGILASQQHGSHNPGNKGELCLSEYTSHVLGALKLNLENKSRVYSMDQSLAAIFLLNNYNFILSALNRYGLLALVQKSIPEIEKIYRSVIAEQKNKYLRSWDKFIEYVGDDKVPHAEPGTKLKDKEKQAVKEKFKSFNNELEDLVKVHRTWAVPDSEIKKEILDTLKKKIVPPYTRFRDRFRMVQFTKNIEKYLKFTPESVAEHIDKLFDQSPV